MKIPSAFSIGKSTRQDEQKKNINPGPGQHNPEVKFTIQKQPQWGFGKQKKFNQFKDETPGPGSYEINYDQIFKNEKKASLKQKYKKQQGGFVNNNNPAPNTYQQNNVFKFQTQPKFTFGAKLNQDKMLQFNENPGVGNYNPSISQGDKNKRRIGTAKRDLKLQNGQTVSPGPAKYNTSRPISAGPMYRFGRSKFNQKIEEKYVTPAPNQYNIKNAFEEFKKAKTMSDKLVINNIDKIYGAIPGPGAYDPKRMDFSASYKIGTGPQRLNREKIENNLPGPGQYFPTEMNRPKSASYKIGLDMRRPLYDIKNVPGPGKYLNTEFINEGQAVGIHGKKMVNPNHEDYPGPGEYQLNYQSNNKQTHSHLIGTSIRRPINHNQIHQFYPGPGSYNITKLPNGPNCVIGKQKRSNIISNDNSLNPGPTSYNIPNSIGQTHSYAKFKIHSNLQTLH